MVQNHLRGIKSSAPANHNEDPFLSETIESVDNWTLVVDSVYPSNNLTSKRSITKI